eukprot:scpid94767/ scgid2162/ 
MRTESSVTRGRCLVDVDRVTCLCPCYSLLKVIGIHSLSLSVLALLGYAVDALRNADCSVSTSSWCSSLVLSSTPEYHPNTGHLSQLQSGIHQRHATILNASPAYLSPLLASDEMLHSLPSVALLVSHYSTHGSTV